MDVPEQEIETSLAGAARIRNRYDDVCRPILERQERELDSHRSHVAGLRAHFNAAKPERTAVDEIDPENALSDCASRSGKANSDCEGLCTLEAGLERILQRVLVPEIMSIEAASLVLHCSVDTLRRIPNEELPAYRVGKINLYLREDILRYVRSRRVNRALADSGSDVIKNDVAALIQGVLGSASVDAREPSIRRVK